MCCHEVELSPLDDTGRKKMLDCLGRDVTALDRLSHSNYALFGPKTYFTSDEKEVRGPSVLPPAVTTTTLLRVAKPGPEPPKQVACAPNVSTTSLNNVILYSSASMQGWPGVWQPWPDWSERSTCHDCLISLWLISTKPQASALRIRLYSFY